jgi:aminoglycoside phosphotransferase (APT) family kinase protein
MVMSLGQPIASGRTADVFAWRDGYILKLYREWCPRQWADQELHIARIVHAAGLAAPAPDEIIEIGPRRGLIYERMDGPSMLQTLKEQPWRLWQLARQMADLQAAMHGCTVAELPAFKDALGQAIRAAPQLPDDLRSLSLQRLAALPDGGCLCHADFHPDNILMTQRGPVVIDWMTAAIGDPLADVARSVVLVRSGPTGLRGLQRRLIGIVTGQFEAAYLKRYFELRPDRRLLLAAWLPVIAAARLNERIEGERERLMEMVTEGTDVP